MLHPGQQCGFAEPVWSGSFYLSGSPRIWQSLFSLLNPYWISFQFLVLSSTLFLQPNIIHIPMAEILLAPLLILFTLPFLQHSAQEESFLILWLVQILCNRYLLVCIFFVRNCHRYCFTPPPVLASCCYIPYGVAELAGPAMREIQMELWASAFCVLYTAYWRHFKGEPENRSFSLSVSVCLLLK